MTDHFVEVPKKVLSPAAQAVLDAVLFEVNAERHAPWIAAALRELANQVVPEEPLYGGDQRWEWGRDTRQSSRKKMLAIATELEGQ